MFRGYYPYRRNFIWDLDFGFGELPSVLAVTFWWVPASLPINTRDSGERGHTIRKERAVKRGHGEGMGKGIGPEGLAASD